MIIWSEVWNIIGIENQKLKEGELIMRTDGQIEWQCEHGVGHTVWAPPHKNPDEQEAWFVHGCDGCCQGNEEFEALYKRLKKVLK